MVQYRVVVLGCRRKVEELVGAYAPFLVARVKSPLEPRVAFRVLECPFLELEKLQKRLELFSRENESFQVLKTELCQKRFLDKPVEALKVFVNQPAAVRAIQQEYGDIEVKEADISLGKKYLIEKQIVPLGLCRAEGYLQKKKGVFIVEQARVESVEGGELEQVKLLSIDIEVAGFMGGVERAAEPVSMIAMQGEGFERVLTWKDFSGKQGFVEVLEDEAGMLRRMVEVIRGYQPDYLLGYYSDGFDFLYLKARAEQLGVKLGLGMDGSSLKVRFGMGGRARILGIPHIDVCKFIKTTMAETLKLDAYDLDSVAYELLGEKKHEMLLEQIGKAWEQGELRKLCEYNLRDAYLTLQLFLKIQHNFHELVKLIGLMPFEVCRLSYGQLVENYLIKRAREFGEIVQNKPAHAEIAARRYESYQGAFVMQPVPGLYEDVVMLDYRSLYPSIIIAKNIAPSSLNLGGGYQTPEIGNQKRVYHFDDGKHAFIPQVIKDIVVRRGRIKEILKQEPDNQVLKARSQALKTLANSAYGMFGFFGARYYSRECAESITAFGRMYIQETIEEARKEGFNVVYADTDSCCMVLEDKTLEDAKSFLKAINKELPEFMELELEKFYTRGIFVAKKGEGAGAKKKYALLDAAGKLKIVGFETVRKDWSLIARETQSHVLEMILLEGRHEHALAFVKEAIQRIQQKKIENKKMVILTQLKMEIDDYRQVGPHVAVAKRLRQQGFEVRAGSLIRFIIREGSGMIRDKAVMPEDCGEGEYDAGYYVEHQMIPAMEKIFEVFHVALQQEIAGGQKNLGEFT